MSRQRMVNDFLWRCAKIQPLTTEDKFALMHLLTCSDSNIIGAYPLTSRIAAAEIGWSQEQWTHVIERLCKANLIDYDRESAFVWVKVWWEHNSASQIFGPKLRGKAINEIKAMPKKWRQGFAEALLPRLSPDGQAWFAAQISAMDMVSIPYPEMQIPYPEMDTYNYNSNPNSKNKSNCNVADTIAPVDKSPVDSFHLLVKNAMSEHESKIIQKMLNRFPEKRQTIIIEQYLYNYRRKTIRGTHFQYLSGLITHEECGTLELIDKRRGSHG